MERVHRAKTCFENDIKTVAEDGSVRRTVELNRPGQTFFAFRGFPYTSKGFGSTGMKVVAVSYPPFDPTAVSVVE